VTLDLVMGLVSDSGTTSNHANVEIVRRPSLSVMFTTRILAASAPRLPSASAPL
jgi:hypothetical protein